MSAFSGAAPAVDSKASQYYEDALVRLQKKDNAGAIIQLKNALKIDRKQLPVQVLLAKALLAHGDVNAAIAAFDEATKLGVNSGEIVLPLAEAMTLTGRPEQLLSDIRFAHANLPVGIRSRLLLMKAAAASDVREQRTALKLLDELRGLEPGSADSWAAEVPIRIRARQFNEAKLAADKAVALDPKSAKAAYQKATLAHVTGNPKAALESYTRTLVLKPDHVDALIARAGLNIDLKQLEEAALDVRAAREADPKDPRAAYLSALLAERAGKPAEVRQNLTEVTNLLDPLPLEFIKYRPQILMLGGLAHFGLDQYGKAKPYLEMVVRQDSASPVSKLLGRIYLSERAADKAVQALEQYLRVQGNDREAMLMLASAQLTLGRHARATQLSTEALKRGDDPSLRTVLGLGLVGAGKLSPGVVELEASLQKDPGQVQAGVTLTGLYLASGQPTKAVATAEALAKRLPNNPGLQNLLGSALAAKGDFASARRAFERANVLDPNYVEPMLGLARADLQQKAFEQALKRLNAILAKDDKNVEAALEVAHVFAAGGRHDETLRWLQRANDFSGSKLQAGLELVDFHLSRGRPDQAREALKTLQSRAPEAFIVLLTQARVQLANREPVEAKTSLTRAATLVAYDAAALVQVANLQLQAGNIPGAAHALDKALVERPDHLTARVMRSNVYVMQGDPAKAEQLARSVMAGDPKSSLGYGLLGDIARARNQPAAAVEAYRRAHQIEHSSGTLLRLFAALEPTQRAAALSLASSWLKEQPGDVKVARALADAQARAGNMVAARATYETLLRASPNDAEALNNLANVLVALRDPAAALRVSEQALALRPEVPHVIGTAGWAAFHANQPDRALQLLRDARLRDASNPNTRYFLGAVLAQLGRRSEARAEIESALQSSASLAYSKEATELLRTLK